MYHKKIKYYKRLLLKSFEKETELLFLIFATVFGNLKYCSNRLVAWSFYCENQNQNNTNSEFRNLVKTSKSTTTIIINFIEIHQINLLVKKAIKIHQFSKVNFEEFLKM